MRSECWILLSLQHAQRLFLLAAEHGVDTHNSIFCMDIVIAQIDAAIFIEHGLKAVDGRSPRHVLHAAHGLREAPRDDGTVSQLLQVARARQARLEEDADGGLAVHQGLTSLLQLRKAVHRNAAFPVVAAATAAGSRRRSGSVTKNDGAGHPDGESRPAFT